MDTRPGHSQLMMMLKKRESFGENELYEMMRSRRVYQVGKQNLMTVNSTPQVQTELRKELERNVQALKRAERLKVAGIVAQREAFLRRVERREMSKRHLVDVKSELGKILSLSVPGDNSEDKPERFDRVFQRERKPVASNTVSRAPAPNNADVVERGELISFRVDARWMKQDVQKMQGKSVSPTSKTSSETTEKTEDRQSGQGGGVYGFDVMQINSKSGRQNRFELSSDDTVTNEDSSRYNATNRLHIKHNQNVPALSVTSEEDDQLDRKDGNELFSVSEAKKDAHEDLLLKPHLSAGIEQHSSSNSHTQLKAKRNGLQPLRLNCTGAHKIQSNSLFLSPQDCLKINKAHAETGSTEHQTIGGHPPSPSGDLARAITMVFIEENEDGDLSPKSLFDFEAWLAYNRRKRGYSRIMDDATRSTGDMEGHNGDTVESQGDKGRLGGHVTLKLSKASPRNSRIHMGKTFREKSSEWYVAFLETRRMQNKSKTFRENPELHRKRHDSAMPEIKKSGNSPGVGIENHRNTTRRVTTETTGQRLQKLREELRLLEVKVQNFLCS